MANAGANLCDAGTSNGIVKFYTGTQPADPSVAATGTLLATVTLGDPAFGAAVAGSKALNAVTPDISADADGTVGWARFYDSDAVDPDDAVFDVSCGGIGSGADIEFDNEEWLIGETVTISSFNFVVPTSQT